MKSKIVAESLTMMTSAFGLVAALAWNEAIKSVIDQFVPKGKGTLSLFIYASIVTILIVIVSTRLARIKQNFEQESK